MGVGTMVGRSYGGGGDVTEMEYRSGEWVLVCCMHAHSCTQLLSLSSPSHPPPDPGSYGCRKLMAALSLSLSRETWLKRQKPIAENIVPDPLPSPPAVDIPVLA